MYEYVQNITLQQGHTCIALQFKPKITVAQGRYGNTTKRLKLTTEYLLA